MSKRIDDEITIGTKIDDSGISTGLKRATSKLNNFVSKAKNLGGLTPLVAGIGVAFAGVSKAINTAIKNVSEMTAAYRTQIKVETQLNQAVKNSPLMSGSTTKNLKDYASQLQSISTYGDEQLLPFMAQLINSGRTEQETMDIMSASVDIAASGMMSLDQAVSSLNMTFQGTTGTLGRQISSIKNLTESELKSGKAIEILKNQFKGTAEEVAKTTGTSDQLKNSIGDLKEEWGAGWEKSLAPARKWLQKLIDQETEILKQKRLLDEAFKNVEGGTGSADDYKMTLAQLKTQSAEINKQIQEARKKSTDVNALSDEDVFTYGNEATTNYSLLLKELEKQYDDINSKIVEYTEKLKKQNEEQTLSLYQTQQQTETEKKAQEIKDANLKSTENYNKIIAKRDETLARLKAEADATGEEVSLQDKLNAEMAAYVEMSLDPGLPTKTKEHLKIVMDLLKETNALAEAEAKRQEGDAKKSAFQEALQNITIEQKKSDVLRDQLQTLDDLNDAFVNSAAFESISEKEKLQIWSEYTQKRKELEKQITEAIEEETVKQETSIEDILSTISDFTQKIADSISNISEMAKTNAENEATTETAALEKQFKEGLISEEEYTKKKEEIEKKAARKQYEAKMWEWSANLAQIAVASAQSIANALTMQPAPLGIAMASVMGALSATQLANAIANKPIPPSFASGGIVGGGAYSRSGTDNIRANVRTGEMILNDRQQLNLWRMAQGGGNSAASGANIQIENYRGSDTTVTPQITEDGVKILIRKTVADDLTNRRLNKSLLTAENQMSGIRYES